MPGSKVLTSLPMLGLKASEVVGKTARELWPGLEDAWISVYQHVAVSDKPLIFEFFNPEAGKNLAISAFRTSPNRFASMFTDVTERRQLLETVAMREKLVAMGQLAAGVAHEMNTPLGNILGYAQLLRSGAAAHPTLSGYAEVIATETKRCSRVVQDLLSYARNDKCSGEACDVNEMVRDLVDAFIHCRLRRYGIAIDLRLSAEAPLAEGGCGEIDIVLTNVLSNAIQALSQTPAPRIEVTTWSEPGHVAIGIADNGPGVAAEARARLFDPFFTTKVVGQGVGLGLFISQAMVTRRGGSLDLDASHAPGARFVIRLPSIDPARVRPVSRSVMQDAKVAS